MLTFTWPWKNVHAGYFYRILRERTSVSTIFTLLFRSHSTSNFWYFLLDLSTYLYSKYIKYIQDRSSELITINKHRFVLNATSTRNLGFTVASKFIKGRGLNSNILLQWLKNQNIYVYRKDPELYNKEWGWPIQLNKMYRSYISCKLIDVAEDA